MHREKTAILVDGSSFIYRAFYASQPATLDDGRHIGAVRGFCSMLISLMNNHRADLFAIVFDSGRETFRLKMYPQYKANRKETPDELKEQFPLIKESCSVLGIPIIEKKGYEADDLIATYSNKLSNDGYEVKIIGIDKDLTQLINENISMFDPMKSKPIYEKDVLEKYGVSPSQMVHLQALIGDAVDNIPGVKGVGPVTAAKLLKKYKTLHGVYENIDDITPVKLKEKLQKDKVNAELSLSLAILDSNIPLEIDYSEMSINYNHHKTVRFFTELGFDFLIGRINKSSFFHQQSLKNAG